MKPKFLNKLTIIDILIIICIIGAIGFAVFHMMDNDPTKPTATSFDTSTKNKIYETYLDEYHNGKIITSTLVGNNSITDEELELNGTVLWVGESENEKVNILLEDHGKTILAGFYNDVPNADVYIDEISLETSGITYTNVTDFRIAPKEIKNLNDIISEIPNGTEYELSTTVAIDNLDNVKYQKLINSLNNNKKPCIIIDADRDNLLKINLANKTDIDIANNVLGDFNGQTSQIVLRVYNTTNADSTVIQSAFNVLSIHKIS